MVVGATRGSRDKNGKRKKLPGYYCRNGACSDHAYVRADELDREVVRRIMAYLNRRSPAKRRVRKQDENTAKLAQAEQDLDEAEHELATFRANRKLVVTLKDEYASWLEDYVTAVSVARETVEILRNSAFLEQAELPSLWAEWTDESRAEFLSDQIEDCLIAPAHRRRVAIGERFALRLVGPVNSRRWILADGQWGSEPDAGPTDTSKLGLFTKVDWTVRQVAGSKGSGI
jgi:hypothetical protein